MWNWLRCFATQLREELGDEITVNVKHWVGAGENVQGSPMFGYHGATPLLATAYHEYEQGIEFKITNPQMFVKRSTGVVTIVFDCQFYGPNKYQDGHGMPVPFMVRLFDEKGQYITRSLPRKGSLRLLRIPNLKKLRHDLQETESRAQRLSVPGQPT